MTLRCGQTLCAEVTYFSDLAVEVLAALRGFHYGGRGGQGVCFVLWSCPSLAWVHGHSISSTYCESPYAKVVCFRHKSVTIRRFKFTKGDRVMVTTRYGWPLAVLSMWEQ